VLPDGARQVADLQRDGHGAQVQRGLPDRRAIRDAETGDQSRRGQDGRNGAADPELDPEKDAAEQAYGRDRQHALDSLASHGAAAAVKDLLSRRA
jgi:hypothetical protein